MDYSKHLFQPIKSKERIPLPKPVAVSIEEARIEGIFTVRQRSCEKVMSSQVWVSLVPCPSRGGRYLSYTGGPQGWIHTPLTWDLKEELGTHLSLSPSEIELTGYGRRNFTGGLYLFKPKSRLQTKGGSLPNDQNWKVAVLCLCSRYWHNSYFITLHSRTS